MRSHPVLSFAVACLAGVLAVHPARATDLSFTFATLPSAQGWTFTSGGSPLATEAIAFSVSGGTLTLNTMSYGFTGAGTSAYFARSGAVNNFEPVVIRMRGRIVQYEGDFANTFVGGGFTFGFSQGATQWGMGITPTQIRNVGGTILTTAFDNTQFHDYRLEWNPPATLRYYVDGTLISTNNAGLGTGLNRIYVGDGTGAANSQSEIKEFRFLQGASTGAQGATWGRIKSLYH